MIWLGGLLLTAIGFIFGRVSNQSEAVLAEKRRVYEAFLQGTPSPEDAYDELTDEQLVERSKRFREVQGPLLLYASPSVSLALAIYLQAFHEADTELTKSSPELHSAYKKAAKAQNDLILEMRRDALGWSVFGFRGESRLPKDALENAKKASL